MNRQPLTRNLLKRFSSLHLHKFRQKYHLFIVAGEKITAEVLREAPEIVSCLLMQPGFEPPFSSPASIAVYDTTDADRKKISALATPPPVLAVCEVAAYESLPAVHNSPYTLVLDGISDPGNLGTIVRTADWFGIGQIYTTHNSVNTLHPRLIQASMGSFLRVKMAALDDTALGRLPRPFLGCTLDGEDYRTLEWPGQATIVMGSESHLSLIHI